MRWSVVLALLAVLCVTVLPAVRAVSDEVEVADEDGADTSEEFELAEVELAADAEDEAEDEAEAEAEEESEDESEAEESADEESESEVEVETIVSGGKKPGAVFLIRHGEKPYPDDKELSSRGRERANALTAYFEKLAKDKGVKIGGVYAQRSASEVPGRKGPTSKRPVDTVVPLAKALKLQVQKFWPEDYQKMVSQILEKGDTAVICWEHDALTDVAKAFGVALTWPEGRYDVTYTITWNSNQKASISESYQNVLVGDVNEGGALPPSIFVLPCDHKSAPSPAAKADQKGWQKWLSGEYALRHGGVRTVIAQKGCQSEIESVAKYLDAKLIDKIEKPKDVAKEAKKAKRENGIVLIVADRPDVSEVTGELINKPTKSPAGAASTLHILYKHKGEPTLTTVAHNSK